MSSKTWIIFVGACLLLLGGLVVLGNQNKLDVSSVDQAKIQQPKEDSGGIGDHVFGNKDSKVTLIEYGDFQCNPGCKDLHDNMKPIMQSEEYKNKFRFVYRNFPITSIHPNTLIASASAEAAGLQGKYWEMWSIIFDNQAEWSGADSSQRGGMFEGYAKSVGLDMDKYAADMAGEKLSKKISYDQALGGDAGVTGTPTVFLNGEKVEGQDMASTGAIKALLDKAIKENK